MSGAANILRRNKCIRSFVELGATSPARAVSPADAGMRHSWIFGQLVDRGVFVPAGNGRYYLDERQARVLLATQRRRAGIVPGFVLWLFLLVLLAARRDQ